MQSLIATLSRYLLAAVFLWPMVGCDDAPAPRRQAAQPQKPDTQPKQTPALQVQEVAQAQAEPMMADPTVGRLGFERMFTPPHRGGMFRAAVAALPVDGLTPDARFSLARAYELAGPRVASEPVAKFLFRELADAGDPRGVTGLIRMYGTRMVATAIQSARLGNIESKPAPTTINGVPRIQANVPCRGADCAKRLPKAIPKLSPAPTAAQFDEARAERRARASAALGVSFVDGRLSLSPVPVQQSRLRLQFDDNRFGMPVYWSPERLGRRTEGAVDTMAEFFVPATRGKTLRFERIWMTVPFQAEAGVTPEAALGNIAANLCGVEGSTLSAVEVAAPILFGVEGGSCSAVLWASDDALVALVGVGLTEPADIRARQLLAQDAAAP